MGRKVLLAVPVLMFLLFLSAGPAAAIEGGLYQYPDGSEDFMMGAMPPPGSYFINLAVYVNISDYKDARGATGAKISRAFGGAKPDIRGWTMIDAPAFLWVSKCKLLGGDFGLFALQPIHHMEMTRARVSGINILDGETKVKTGLKNTVLGVLTGWHFSKNLHVTGAFDVIMPTGAYSTDDFVNPGNPAWQFMPVAAISYITDKGFEVGAKLMYDIYTTNKETHYRSGQTFHADYIIGQHFGNFGVGINGYYIYQVTDDKINNNEDPNFDGNKASVISVGPAVMYQYKNQFFKAKAQFDVYEKNRQETQRFWFNYVYCF